MKQIVHVARQAIASNQRHGLNEPPIIVRDYRGSIRSHEVLLENPQNGEVLGRFVYTPDNPLHCGARVYLELDTDKLKAVPA